jgi:hypothetical protein
LRMDRIGFDRKDRHLSLRMDWIRWEGCSSSFFEDGLDLMRRMLIIFLWGWIGFDEKDAHHLSLRMA